MSMIAVGILFLGLSAPPDVPPVPPSYYPAMPEECTPQDIMPGMLITADCWGVLGPRRMVLNAALDRDYVERLESYAARPIQDTRGRRLWFWLGVGAGSAATASAVYLAGQLR